MRAAGRHQTVGATDTKVVIAATVIAIVMAVTLVIATAIAAGMSTRTSQHRAMAGATDVMGNVTSASRASTRTPHAPKADNVRATLSIVSGNRRSSSRQHRSPKQRHSSSQQQNLSATSAEIVEIVEIKEIAENVVAAVDADVVGAVAEDAVAKVAPMQAQVTPRPVRNPRVVVIRSTASI